ncbi:MAG: rod shape-determining protein MreD [Nitrospirae bacterium]|nr:rod shape-determining protein MreD [Nitrospirota bacterium]
MIYLFLAFLALAAQSEFFTGIKPDILFVLVCFYSLRYGQAKGMLFGALTGLLLDLSSGFIPGTNIISMALAGYAIASVRQRVFQWNIIINTVAIIMFSILDIFLVHVILATFADIYFANRPLTISVMQIVYTAIFSLLLYPVLDPEKTRDSLALFPVINPKRTF